MRKVNDILKDGKRGNEAKKVENHCNIEYRM